MAQKVDEAADFVFAQLTELEPYIYMAAYQTKRELYLKLLLGQAHAKETGNCNATAISESCYQPELDACY
jgi:hypothetical protein